MTGPLWQVSRNRETICGRSPQYRRKDKVFVLRIDVTGGVKGMVF